MPFEMHTLSEIPSGITTIVHPPLIDGQIPITTRLPQDVLYSEYPVKVGRNGIVYGEPYIPRAFIESRVITPEISRFSARGVGNGKWAVEVLTEVEMDQMQKRLAISGIKLVLSFAVAKNASARLLGNS
jgi:hypothetical protein